MVLPQASGAPQKRQRSVSTPSHVSGIVKRRKVQQANFSDLSKDSPSRILNENIITHGILVDASNASIDATRMAGITALM